MTLEPKRILRDALLWSEQHTKTDMVYLASGGFWLSLARFVGMATSLALAVVMANLLDPTIYGTYQFVLSLAGIIGALSLAGIGSAITQAVARGYDGALYSGMHAYAKWSVIVVITAFGAAGYYYINDNMGLAISLFLVGIFHPIFTTFNLSSSFLAGKKDFKRQAIFGSLRSTVPAVALIGAIFFTQNPALIVLTYLVSNAAIATLLYAATIYVYHPGNAVDSKTNPYGFHLSVMGFIGKVAENLDKILVFHYVGAAELAIYAFALTPISQLKMLTDTPVQLSFPKLSERPLAELRRTLPRKIFLFSVGMGVIALIYIIFAPFLFDILFPQYTASVIFTQVLALTLILAPFSLLNEALIAHMKKRELYISRTAMPLLKIVLLLILLPRFHIWGAVVSIIVVQLISIGIYGLQFRNAK